jgi:hypothetical protein
LTGTTALELIKKTIETSAADLGLKAVAETSRLIDQWVEIVGKPLAGKTRPAIISGKTLLVATAGPAWSHQLSMLKVQLLLKLRNNGFEIGELRFTQLADTVPPPTETKKTDPPPDFAAIPPEITAAKLRKAMASFAGAAQKAASHKDRPDMIK